MRGELAFLLRVLERRHSAASAVLSHEGERRTPENESLSLLISFCKLGGSPWRDLSRRWMLGL